jgi:two-component system, cell cycle sensor histidine kinase and response regulator CckA
MAESIRVLIVDDAPEHAEMVKDFIHLIGSWSSAHVDTASTYDGALKMLRTSSYDVAFFDYYLDRGDGLDLLRDARAIGADMPVIVLTGRGAEEVAVEVMKAGAADYLNKSNLSIEAIEQAIRHAVAIGDRERQRRHAEAALRASEERFRALVENSSDALLMIDLRAIVNFISASSQRHLGWTAAEMMGRSLFEFLHADDREYAEARMGEALRNPGATISAEVRFKHKDGHWRTMETFAVNRLEEPAVGAIVINARDITDRRRLENQLRQSQKMDAVGRLAGGVAHDFNNLLTAILGYCNLILDDIPADNPLRADLEEIRSAGDRAAALTRQLLAFSRRQMLQPQAVDVNQLITQVEKMLQRLIGEDVELVTALAPDLESVRVDPASLEQVLVNLAVNSRDAMPLGGRLTIETAHVDLDNAYEATHASIEPGRYVMLAVSDTGHGMDAATCARVFEPFFTTKEQGKGVGLGLATVYGIVKQNGGYIWVYSEPERGTTFKVYLPPIHAGAEHYDAEPQDDGAKRGGETVLLVEDEDAVRVLAREVLRRQGYVVLEARHGLDALRVAERHADPIQLMITDVVMPHMSGRDLAERLVVARPHMKVLFISGYTDHAVMHRELMPGSEFLQKPFTPVAFVRKVRGVLDTVSDAS